MLDCAGRVLTWNRGAEHNKGYSSAEVLGQHYSLFFVPEDIEAGIPDRELASAAVKGRCSGEGWRLRKNGERFWASFLITTVRSQSGKLLGYAKVIRDLTERKRQEDALRRMEAVLRRERDRLRAAAESSMDALLICEAVRGTDGDIEDFVFTYLNSNVEKMVSIPREVLIHGKMANSYQPIVARVFSTRTSKLC
jgi:PAS domain S-box-containing protein